MTLSGSINNNLLETTTNFGQSDDNYISRNLTLAVRQPLYRPNLWKGMEQAQSMVEDATAVLRAEEQNLIMKVAAAYFDALQTEDQLKLIEAQRTPTLSQLDAARNALTQAPVPAPILTKPRRDSDMVQAQALEARQNADFTRRTLSAMVQQPADVLAMLDPNRLDLQALNPTDLQEWLDDAQRNSPELQALTARVRSAELEVDKATAGHKPTLDAVAQLSSSESENVTGSLRNTTTKPGRAVQPAAVRRGVHQRPGTFRHRRGIARQNATGGDAPRPAIACATRTTWHHGKRRQVQALEQGRTFHRTVD
ncbi:MAG: TolC family protein [Rhodoferax sp.]|nr:TolC family protein [Rhodoferax sp.]